MRFFRLFLIIISLGCFLFANDDAPPVEYDYLSKKEVQYFIDMMVKKHHFERNYLESVLKNAKFDTDTLKRYTGKYVAGSTNGPWERYKAHVLDPVSLQKAKDFKKNYATTLERASKDYDVPVEYIVGFIGVESKFGEYTGDYRILDALATLAFHPNRMQKFFKNEFEQLFLMSREQGYDITKLQGSFAGAMGCVQQVPSVYRKFGMDYNNDGVKNPWDLEDCIGIIARFMHQNGWRNGMSVAVKTNFADNRYRGITPTHKSTYTIETLNANGIYATEEFQEPRAYLLRLRNDTHDDLWLGGSNFRILTRYNNATTYGMAIHLIAQSVK
ncbi:MAG: lytic murein transglycosylase [Sulfurovaceae bacterium]|nr:lytic murein transglycosylase [Sulfurovaceae bacterium]MDD5548586.1 lytic murein transglycosylase [Sulfurovaceae bacterium]